MAAPNDVQSCLSAIANVERGSRMPPALLRAIGLVESGRLDPPTRQFAPWPWTINVDGIDHVFANKDDAMRAVEAVRASGSHSIDVGCMQISLKFHPTAFATLADAFDPQTNVTYAAGFLWALHGALGSWPAAAAAYHSQTPALASAYIARVTAFWPPGLGYVVPGAAAPAAQTIATLVDPYDVMTSEEKARRIQAAADRAVRDAAYHQGGAPYEPTNSAPGLAASRPPAGMPRVPPDRRARLDQQAGLAAIWR